MFLCKSKENQAIIIFEFNPKQDFPLEMKRKIEEIGDIIKRFDVYVYYPKQFAEKLKKHAKASMTVKFSTPTSIILTGKLGEIITIDSQQIKNKTAL